MVVFGYILALVVGLTLGILGGGGSILAVPIFKYLFDQPIEKATAYSLFVVGVVSIVGVFRYRKNNSIHWQAFLFFGLPAVITVFFIRNYVIHTLPDTILEIGRFSLSKDMAIMMLFAILMLVASRSMIIGREFDETDERPISGVELMLVVIWGSLTGFLTSLVGAGGGFIIIPALIMLFRMSVKKAVGTSLACIMVNSIAGFSGDLKADLDVDWNLLLAFTGLAIVGIIIGTMVSSLISGDKLKSLFGWFVFVLGVIIIGSELINF